MIKAPQRTCRIDDTIFNASLDLITRSGAAKDIRAYVSRGRSSGGRKPSRIAYTVEAVLTSLLIRFRMGRPYSIAGALETIGEFTDQQAGAVGMAEQDRTLIYTDSDATYKAFNAWWARQLTPLDPFFDLRVRRMINTAFDTHLEARSPETAQQSQQAQQRLTALINRLVAASVEQPAPAHCVGDVVVDETTIATATPGGMIGALPDRYRGANHISSSWARYKTGPLPPGGRRKDQISKYGFGFGITAVTRVAQRDALHSEPPVFIGIAVHGPTGANVEGVVDALTHAKNNGVDSRRGGRSRMPLITADMGYSMRKSFGRAMLELGYSPVIRYGEQYQLRQLSVDPIGGNTPSPGPIQYAGSFYCPAVPSDALNAHKPIPSTELLKHDRFRSHDQRLRRIFPFLMGHNSRLELKPLRRGRPRLGHTPPQVAKIRLVCPAAMGTVRCPLKPESMVADNAIELPLAKPDWPAEAMTCCAKSSVTVTLTDRQLQMAQLDLVAGSHEHTTYYEAARSLTEQRFSLLKSRYGGALDQMTSGPRRTAMTAIAAALAAVTVNLETQRNYDRTKTPPESIARRMKQMTEHLGYEPVRTPPRT